MPAEPESDQFPRAYVEKLRGEAASARVELKEAKAALGFYINRFPLGDIDNFSVSRMCYAMAQNKLWGKSISAHAPYEKAYYDGLSQYENKAQGDQVSGIDGGFLAPELWGGPYFSLLRSFSVLNQLPITTLRVPARVRHLPKLTGDITMVYPGENVALTNTQFKFGQMSYTARKATSLIPVSNELLRDAPQMADQVLRQESAFAHALDRDTQALIGQGGTNPTGLVTMATNGTVKKWYPGSSATTAITTTPGNATPSFLHISQLRGQIHQLNGAVTGYTGQAHCNGIIAHSRFEQTVLIQGTAAGAWTDNNGRPFWVQGLARASELDARNAVDPLYGTMWGGDPNKAFIPGQNGGSLMGQAWALTNILPTNSIDGGGTTASFMIAGWWQMYVLFECNEFQYDVAIEPAFSSDQTLIRAVHRYDCAPALPEAFAVLAGCNA